MEKEVVVLFFPCPQPPSPLLHCRVQDWEWGKSRKEGRAILTGMWISHSLAELMVRGPAQGFSRFSPLQSSWAEKVHLYLHGQMHSSLCSRFRWLQQGWSNTFLLRFPHTFSHQQTSFSGGLVDPWETVVLSPLFQAACDGKENRKSYFRELAHGERWECKWGPSHKNWGSVKSWGVVSKSGTQWALRQNLKAS